MLAKWVEHLLPFAGLLAVIFAYHFCTCGFLGASLSQDLAISTSPPAGPHRIASPNTAAAVAAAFAAAHVASLCNHSPQPPQPTQTAPPPKKNTAAIFLCVWLSCSVHKANDVIRKIVGQTACEPSELAAAVIFVGTNVALTLWLAGGQQLRALALLPPPDALSVWQVLFSIAITDALVRCCGIIPKLLIAAVTMLPRRRGAGGGKSGGSSSPGDQQQQQPKLQRRRYSSDGPAVASGLKHGSGSAAAGRPNSSIEFAVGSRGLQGGAPPSWTSSRSSMESLSECSGSTCSAGAGCSSGSSSPASSTVGSSRLSVDLGEIAADAATAAAAAATTVAAAVCCGGADRHTHFCHSSYEAGSVNASAAAARRARGAGFAMAGAGAGAAATQRQQLLAPFPSAPLPSAAAPSRPSLAHGLGVTVGASSAQVCARRRARMLALYDNVQASYRALLPIPVWWCYLLRAAVPSASLATLLSAAYLSFKAYGLLQRGQLLLLATRLVLRTGALYGRYLTKGEVSAGGEPPGCPICQDVCSSAIRLDCSHVFCEDCLAEWLEREPTCPMCRSTVKPPGLVFGDGSTSLLPLLF
jgi:hypothetical protein